jgi:hypothetical protein
MQTEQDITKMIYRWLVILILLSQSLYSQVQFQVPGITVPASPTIDLPVVIQTNNNVVGSLEFALNYDPTILRFEEIKLSSTSQTWLTYTMDDSNGKLRWGGYDNTYGSHSITQPTELFTVKFAVLNQNWTTTPITIGRKTAGDAQGWSIPVTNTNGYINYSRSVIFVGKDAISAVAYPNPVITTSNISLTLPSSSTYFISLHDFNGNLLKSFKGFYLTGSNTFEVDLTPYQSGIYILRITDNINLKTIKSLKN